MDATPREDQRDFSTSWKSPGRHRDGVVCSWTQSLLCVNPGLKKSSGRHRFSGTGGRREYPDFEVVFRYAMSLVHRTSVPVQHFAAFFPIVLCPLGKCSGRGKVRGRSPRGGRTGRDAARGRDAGQVRRELPAPRRHVHRPTHRAQHGRGGGQRAVVVSSDVTTTVFAIPRRRPKTTN